ncbi:MAG: glucodextranase DOMON-like domain-containing protein [Myxococcota bacterium]
MMSAAATVLLMAVAGSVTFSDPRYDDRGTGRYVYPIGTWYQRGDFDLRALTVQEDGDFVVFKVRMDRPFTRPSRVQLTEHRALEYETEIYVQNIDIYIDTSPTIGETEGVPGRNVQFHPHEAWDRAIVLTPQPYVVRQSLRKWKPAAEWVVPDTIRSRGPEVWVRVPVHWLGSYPRSDWGYQVVVTGALLQTNFEVFDRVTNAVAANALTMPVYGVAEVQAFGGGELDRRQPRAVDILNPPDRSQFVLLQNWNDEHFAALPMVRAGAPLAPEKAAPAPSIGTGSPTTDEGPVLPRLEATLQAPSTSSTAPTPTSPYLITKVLDVSGQHAVLAPLSVTIPDFKFGEVLSNGEVVGRVVVTGTYPKFMEVTVVKGLDRIRVGSSIRFKNPLESQ